MDKINQLKANFEILTKSDVKAVNFFNTLIDAYLEKNTPATPGSSLEQQSSSNNNNQNMSRGVGDERYAISYSNNSALSIRHIVKSEASNRGGGCSILDAPSYFMSHLSKGACASASKSASSQKKLNDHTNTTAPTNTNMVDNDTEVIDAIMRSNNNSCLTTQSQMSGSASRKGELSCVPAQPPNAPQSSLSSKQMSGGSTAPGGRFCPSINVPYVVKRKCSIGQIKVKYKV
jgi:hypothetical protein